MKGTDVAQFLCNIDMLPKGKRTLLARNHALYKNAKFDVIITFSQCIPDNVQLFNEREKQNLLFVASVRCELGDDENLKARDAIAEKLSENKSGATHFSDLLQQTTSTDRVYPLMRRYLSMQKNPIDTFALFWDLQFWDDIEKLPGGRTTPVKYEWAEAFAKNTKVTNKGE